MCPAPRRPRATSSVYGVSSPVFPPLCSGSHGSPTARPVPSASPRRRRVNSLFATSERVRRAPRRDSSRQTDLESASARGAWNLAADATVVPSQATRDARQVDDPGHRVVEGQRVAPLAQRHEAPCLARQLAGGRPLATRQRQVLLHPQEIEPPVSARDAGAIGLREVALALDQHLVEPVRVVGAGRDGQRQRGPEARVEVVKQPLVGDAIEAELHHEHARVVERTHELARVLQHAQVHRLAQAVRRRRVAASLVQAQVLEGVQHLAVGAQHVDPAALALEVLLDEDLVGATLEHPQPLAQRLRVARHAGPPPVAQVLGAERRARLHHDGQREVAQHLVRVGGDGQDEMSRDTDADLATHVVAPLLVVPDAIRLLVQEVDARVRLQVGAVLLQRDDRRVVRRDHEIEALARAQVEEGALPRVVTGTKGGGLVRHTDVSRAPRDLGGRAPGDVHLGALAAERTDDGEEARVALAEHQHLAGAGGAHAGARLRDSTSSKTSSTARAWPSMSKTALTRTRAARDMAARRAGSSSNATMAAASASGSRGGTRSPVSPSATISSGPPSRGAITGRLAAMASSSTRPNGSRFEACTTTSIASMQAATSRRAPVRTTCPARSGAAMRSRSRAAYSAPRRCTPPTIRQRSAGMRRRARAAASATSSWPFQLCTCPTMPTHGASGGMPSARRTPAPPPVAKRPTSMPS